MTEIEEILKKLVELITALAQTRARVRYLEEKLHSEEGTTFAEKSDLIKSNSSYQYNRQYLLKDFSIFCKRYNDQIEQLFREFNDPLVCAETILIFEPKMSVELIERIVGVHSSEEQGKLLSHLIESPSLKTPYIRLTAFEQYCRLGKSNPEFVEFGTMVTIGHFSRNKKSRFENPQQRESLQFAVTAAMHRWIHATSDDSKTKAVASLSEHDKELLAQLHIDVGN